MDDNKLLSHHRRAFHEVKLEIDYIEKMLCGKEFNHDLRIIFKPIQKNLLISINYNLPISIEGKKNSGYANEIVYVKFK